VNFELEYPGLPWREPLLVKVPGVGDGLACRLCVAKHGLRGNDVVKLPQTREEFDKHMAEQHGGTDGTHPA
jgi:hypothetical protein